MAITTLDGLVAALPTASVFQINKASIATQAAAGYSSLWRATGVPAQGAIPGAFARCTNALTGALRHTNPVSGNAYLALLTAACGNAGQNIQIHDRLAHMGGLSGATTGNQTVNVDVTGTTANLDERIGAADFSEVQWWAEIYTDIGTSGQTCTVTYTRDPGGPGNTGQTTTFTLGGASPANQDARLFPIIPAGTDRIQSIQTVSIGTTTGAAGSWGITATKYKAELQTAVANRLEVADWAALGLPIIYDDSCLMMLTFSITTSTGVVVGNGKIAKG